MLIDGFTLVAQLVNFLVLVWLLKRFLYKPILNAIDERERYIASQFREADAKKADADKELDANKRMNEEFGRQRQALLDCAMGEIETERVRLTQELHNDIESLRSNYLETLRTDQQSLSSEIAFRTQMEILDIARKTLNDLATVSLEEQMVETFLNKLKALPTDQHQLLISGFATTKNMVVVQSSFDLEPQLKSSIKDVLQTLLDAAPNIRYETDKNLISGIALIVSGYKVIWSIDEYLANLKNNLALLINEKYESNAAKNN